MEWWKRHRVGPQQVLRWGTEDVLPWRERLRSPRTLSQLAIVGGLFLCLLLVIELPHPRLPVHKGEKAINPILSRVHFEEENPDLTAVVQGLGGLQAVPRLYKPNESQVAALGDRLKALIDDVAKAPDLGQVPAAARKAWPVEVNEAMFAAIKKAVAEKAAPTKTGDEGPAAEKPATEKSADGKNPPEKTEDPVAAAHTALSEALSTITQPQNLPILSDEEAKNADSRLKRIEELQNKLPARLFPKDHPLWHEPASVIGLLLPQTKEGEYQPLAIEKVLKQRQAAEIREKISELIGPTLAGLFGADGAKTVETALAAGVGPTLLYDQSETEKRRSAAAKSIEPVRNVYEANSTLIEAGKEITDSDLKLLAREQQAWMSGLGWWNILLAWLGAAIIVGLLVALLALDTLRLQRNASRSFPRTLMLALLVLAVVGASKLVVQMRGPDELSTFFLLVAALVVTVAYGQVFALAMTGTAIFLVAIATRADVDWVITVAVGTSVAILALGEINNRTILVRIGALAGAALFIARGALAFWRLDYADSPGLQPVLSVLWFSFLNGCAGLAAGVVLLAILPYIERAFGIVTNISLLELCDVNQPALRRLAMEAPGTYTHSLLIGSLAEAASESIGANGLLARVGAYFHDIGKAVKPRYFVENWEEGEDGHTGLSPIARSQVILNHVKDGLEMANRVGLPPILKQFIAEHHGTTHMSYFYREAVRRQKAEGGPVPIEAEYRYPGPKPRSRETALVMLADAVEGATRSQPDRSAAKIAETVHEIVMNRLLDGQLDRSGLTLTDLRTVEETLTKTLLSVYHGRVPYPTGRRSGDGRTDPLKDKGTGSGGSAPTGPER
jgi:cyclic-di-AMP phosphodiesterase PgpH